MFRKRQTGEVPQGIENWYPRAIPLVAAHNEGYRGRAADKYAHALALGNAAFMRDKRAKQGGEVTGYHGTTSPIAEIIKEEGFLNLMNEERLTGVSAWDEVVALNAVSHAANRAMRAGHRDEGQIIVVRMFQPEYDHMHGRLEWLVDANNAEVLDVYSPKQMRQHLRELDRAVLH